MRVYNSQRFNFCTCRLEFFFITIGIGDIYYIRTGAYSFDRQDIMYVCLFHYYILHNIWGVSNVIIKKTHCFDVSQIMYLFGACGLHLYRYNIHTYSYYILNGNQLDNFSRIVIVNVIAQFRNLRYWGIKVAPSLWWHLLLILKQLTSECHGAIK